VLDKNISEEFRGADVTVSEKLNVKYLMGNAMGLTVD
jgi:hypothetical protein